MRGTFISLKIVVFIPCHCKTIFLHVYFKLTTAFFFLCLGIYLTVVMAITSISVVVTVVVLNFHYRGPSRKEVPSYLRDLVLQRVNSSCSCFGLRSPKKKKTCTSYDIVQLPTYKVKYGCTLPYINKYIYRSSESSNYRAN